jgi:hypothetical protein
MEEGSGPAGQELRHCNGSRSIAAAAATDSHCSIRQILICGWSTQADSGFWTCEDTGEKPGRMRAGNMPFPHRYHHKSSGPPRKPADWRPSALSQYPASFQEIPSRVPGPASEAGDLAAVSTVAKSFPVPRDCLSFGVRVLRQLSHTCGDSRSIGACRIADATAAEVRQPP